MIGPNDLIETLAAHGYAAFSGVPCSYLTGVFAALEASGRYTAAPHEGIALALCAGHELGGTPSAVFLQNSGLGNLLDPLTSLVLPYQIPVLLVVSMRGWPTMADDEPHHAVMGNGTADVLAAVGVETALLTGSSDDLAELLARAAWLRGRRRPFAILTTRDTFGSYAGPTPADEGQRLPALSPEAVIAAVRAHLPQAFVVSTTGLISRELYRQDDAAHRFYVQGSMGHAITVGLGRCLSVPDQRVVVLDGDGSALMHLGASALVGGRRPANLVHVILDNGRYESTGGQLAARPDLDWAEVGRGLGYRDSTMCSSADELAGALQSAVTGRGPVLIACRVGSHRARLPRISERWSNPEIFARARDTTQPGRKVARQ